MKLDIAKYKKYYPKVAKIAGRYGVFTFVVSFLVIYVFLAQRIGTLINSEPATQATSEAAAKPIGRLTIDKSAIEQMRQLENQNVQVQTLFEEARQNPFAE